MKIELSKEEKELIIEALGVSLTVEKNLKHNEKKAEELKELIIQLIKSQMGTEEQAILKTEEAN